MNFDTNSLFCVIDIHQDHIFFYTYQYSTSSNLCYQNVTTPLKEEKNNIYFEIVNAEKLLRLLLIEKTPILKSD